MLGYQWTEDLGKYLGVLIFHKRPTRSKFQFINALVAGKPRLCLLREDSLSRNLCFKLYPLMLCNQISSLNRFCDEVDKACRSFLWGDSSDQRHMYLLSLDKICQSKVDGSLRLRHTRDVNDAFMMRVGWNICNSPNALWVSCYKG